MDQSQRHNPGKGAPASRSYYKYVPPLLLVGAAVGFALLQPAGAPTEAPLSNQDVTATITVEYPVDPAARGGAGNQDQKAKDSTAAGLSAEAAGERDLLQAALRDGYTLAEICAADDSLQYHCRIGHYDPAARTVKDGAPQDSMAGHRIAGQVMTNDGEPLAGVSIVATPIRLRDKHEPDVALRFRTLTDALGRYQLKGLPEGEYMVRSGAQGGYQPARVAARTGASNANLVMAGSTRTVIEGQVVDESGEPLADVVVLPDLLGQPSVLSGQDGRFALDLAMPGLVDSVGLRYQRPGYEEQLVRVTLPRPGAERAEVPRLSMSPVTAWTSIAGRVLSDGGEPVPFASVELGQVAGKQLLGVSTDADGRFEFPMVAAATDYQLTVSGDSRYHDFRRILRAEQKTDELAISLVAHEYGSIAGKVVNRNGEPVSDFDLVIKHAASIRPNAVVRTDDLGNFELTDAPAGSLTISSQSTPAIRIEGIELAAGGRLDLPVIVDWGSHELNGVVVDARGEPVPATRVVLRWTNHADGITTSATRRTAADAFGQFAFSNLGPGPHLLHIEAPGHPAADIEHDLGRQGYDLTVRLN